MANRGREEIRAWREPTSRPFAAGLKRRPIAGNLVPCFSIDPCLRSLWLCP